MSASRSRAAGLAKLALFIGVASLCNVSGAGVEERMIDGSNHNVIQKINDDAGPVVYLTIACGVLVLASGIKMMVAARGPRRTFIRWVMLHACVILLVGTFGAFMHFAGLYSVHAAAVQSGQTDPVQVAGDRQVLAQGDMGFCGIVMVGALLGAVALLVQKNAELHGAEA